MTTVEPTRATTAVRRAAGCTLVALLATLATVTAATPVAALEAPPTFLYSFGAVEAGDPDFLSLGVAVDGNGDVWASDAYARRPWKFTSTGTLLSGPPGPTPPFTSSSSDVDVDADGNVYVLHTGCCGDQILPRIEKYDSTGSLLTSWDVSGVGVHHPAMAVDADGNVYVTEKHSEPYEANGRIKKFDSSGTLLATLELESFGSTAPNLNGIAVDAQGDIYVTDSNTVRVLDPSGSVLREFTPEVPGDRPLPAEALAVDADGNLYGTTGSEVWKTDPSGAFLTAWGANATDLDVGVDGNVYVADVGNHQIQVFGSPSCTLPEESATEAGTPPPAVGNWKFAGCWRKTGATTWEAETEINVNGLLLTPGAGAKIVLDTSGPSLSATGQVTVATGAFSVGGVSRPSVTLYQGSLNWSLSAASLALPLASSMKLIGLAVQDTTATLTAGPAPGEVSIGPIEVRLPDLIGGTGEVTLSLTPGGVRASSWRVGPIDRTLGGLVPVQGLRLEANAQGWGVSGNVSIPGSPSAALGGSVAYTGDTLSGASVTAGDIELFGGVMAVTSFQFTWSAAAGWRAQAAATVPGQSGSTVAVDLDFGGDGALSTASLFVSRAALGAVARIEQLDLDYAAAQDQWTGSANVVMAGPSGTAARAAFVLRAGEFVSGTFTVDPLSLGVGPGVRLTRLQAQFDSDPWRIEGQVGFGAGPTIEGRPAVRINGTGSYTYPAGAAGGLFRVDANVALTDFQLLSGWLEYRPTGRLTFAGTLGTGGGFTLPGITLDAGLQGWVDAAAGYSAQGNASMTVNGVAITGQAVVSSTGIAACGGVKAGWTWQTGFGYRWVGNQLTVLANSCDLRPWTTQAPETAGAEGTGPDATFVVPAGAEVHGVRFSGTTAPPLVTLSGPGGESLVTPTDPGDLGVQDDYVVVQDLDAKTTTFLIDTPTAGTWQAHLQAGSSPLAGTATAVGIPDPEVSASVSGTGATRTLAWELTPQAGQVVTFVEEGPETAAVIATTSDAAGQVEFTPADGPAGTRDIVALVEQDGIPRSEITLISYGAPAGATLTVDRSGSGAGTVTSSPAGIDCGTTCDASFDPGNEVTLTATPTGGSTFEGWSGPCEGAAACTITLDSATTVGAGFAAPDNQAPTAPSVTGPTAPLLTGNAFTVTWGGGTDPDGTVAGYDVRHRSAGLNAVFAAPVDWQTVTTATTAAFTGTAARTYCFAARTVDDDGATSAWSAERCTATPLDDRGLTPRGGFTRKTQVGNLANTYSQATARNATLTRTAVTARRIGIIVQRGNGYGTVQVRHAGRLLGTIDLQAPTTRKKQLITYVLPVSRTGSLVLTATSTNRPVRIDGIVAAAA